ncbi:MAG TPA: hypothetical protein ENN87_12445 [Phycisphaerales bacterium]|nr:hypothetical protein [Phycisphaerales bacterium]
MNRICAGVFHRHCRLSLVLLVLVCIMVTVGLVELVLRVRLGLGRPVLYDSSPVYGYRPLPGGTYRRFGGARLHFNNLGLRAEADWDGEPDGKILFLGDSVTYGGSYVGNDQLFSALATRHLPGYIAGNGGVNAWGVENIVGLVVETGFQPAEVYVTVVPEADFYRGLVRCQGLPFFNAPPRSGLEELWRFFCYRENNKRYREWTAFADDAHKRLVADKAAGQLAKMDRRLREKGHIHVLFITPQKAQALGREDRDALVAECLERHGLEAVYIADRLAGLGLPADQIEALYHDMVHLSLRGHELWGQIIGEELAGRLDGPHHPQTSEHTGGPILAN